MRCRPVDPRGNAGSASVTCPFPFPSKHLPPNGCQGQKFRPEGTRISRLPIFLSGSICFSSSATLNNSKARGKPWLIERHPHRKECAMHARLTVVLAALILSSTTLWAHGIVGNRMFIEPLFTEDANVKNELVLPFLKFGVQPDGTWRQTSFALEKQLYPERLSIILESGRMNRHDGSSRLSGWDNLELGVKFQAYTNDAHEFLLSPALFAALPTSSRSVTEHETSLTPMLLFGKGLNEAPSRWMRPLAIQGDVGFSSSVRGPSEKEFQFNAVLMYSVPYLNHYIRKADDRYAVEHSLRRGLSRGALLGNLFPFVEFNSTHPINSEDARVSSSLRPGILWMGQYVQASLAADIPVQYSGAEDRPHRGVCISFDWFLDEIFDSLKWTPFGNHSRSHGKH